MRFDLDKQKDKIIKLHQNGLSIGKLSNMYKCDFTTLKRKFKKWNIKIINHIKNRIEILEKEKQKIVLMNQNGYGITKLANIYNLDENTIMKRFKIWNIPYIKQREYYDKIYIQHKKNIIKLYNEGYSQYIIAKKLNLVAETVESYLKKWKIKIRSKVYQNSLIKTKDGSGTLLRYNSNSK